MEDPFAMSDGEGEQGDVVNKVRDSSSYVPTEDMARFLFSRPGEDPEGDMVVTLPSGERYYMLVNNHANEHKAHVLSEDNDPHTSVSELVREIEEEASRKEAAALVHDAAVAEPSEATGSSQVLLSELKKQQSRKKEKDDNDTEHQIWVEKYSPNRFIDLVSDERTNRLALKWLKSWDEWVFKKKKPKRRGVKEDNGGDSRPEQKILLLSGPPGTGKTTLARIAAIHAGYWPVEINASDERTASVLQNHLIGAMETQSAFHDGRPKCLILDEIEGMANQGTGRGAIHALLSLVNAPMKKDKKKRSRYATRPVICICNDAYAPVLRPLRGVSFSVNVKPAAEARLTQRLFEVCKLEKLHAKPGVLSLLCHQLDNDIRACLHALQFLQSKTKTITLEMAKASVPQEKDTKAHIFTTMDALFKPEKRSRGRGKAVKKYDSEASVLKVLAKHGVDFEIVLAAIHHNLPQMKYNDTQMLNSAASLEWISYFDTLYYQTRSKGNYSLISYLPYVGVALKANCTFESGSRASFPSPYFEHNALKKRNRSLLEELCRSGSMTGVSGSVDNLAMDAALCAEKLFPILHPTEGKLLDLFKLSEIALATSDKGEPIIEKRVVKKHSRKEDKENRTDFFGRPGKRGREGEEDGLSESNAVKKVAFFFNEGFTDAIRRPVKLVDFMFT